MAIETYNTIRLKSQSSCEQTAMRCIANEFVCLFFVMEKVKYHKLSKTVLVSQRHRQLFFQNTPTAPWKTQSSLSLLLVVSKWTALNLELGFGHWECNPFEDEKTSNEINGKANSNGYLYRLIYCIHSAVLGILQWGGVFNIGSKRQLHEGENRKENADNFFSPLFR